MATAIVTTTGKALVPKFGFTTISNSGIYPPYFQTTEDYDMIKYNALTFNVNIDRNFLESCIKPENIIKESSGQAYYKTQEPLRLKNGNLLYLNSVFDSGSTKFLRSHIVYNPSTDTYDFQGAGFSTTFSNLHLFLPIIVVFENDNYVYFGYLSSTTQYFSSSRGYLYFMSDVPIIPGSDRYNSIFSEVEGPYEEGGESGEGGGTGDFDGTSEPIDIPDLPTISAVDSGFITLFNPSLSELQNLASYMWGDIFDITNWKKLFADPMDAILGLSIVPVAVPNAGQYPVKVGNISTGISMNKAAAQFVSVDCGTLNVNEFWGAYLDYEPYTKAEIYLPYIGTHALSVDDIMGKQLHVVYHVDILSGSCCVYLKCGESVLYTYVGQCSSAIPVTGNDFAGMINGAISMATAIGTMVATGGASAPMAVPALATTAVNSMKPSVEKSGSMGGTGGMLGIQKPYLILTRPRQALPANQNSFIGYPSLITVTLGECTGYTVVDSIHLENIPATESELSEIESLLKAGVIL